MNKKKTQKINQTNNITYVYFTCIFCGKSLATNEFNAVAKAPCPDCGKPLVLPVSAVYCKCQHCGTLMATLMSMIGQQIQCLECQKKTYLFEMAHENFARLPIPEPTNITPSNNTSIFQLKRRISLKERIRRFNYLKNIPRYSYVNTALVLCLVISMIFFHDSALERFFRLTFLTALFISIALEGYLFYLLKTIKSKRLKNNKMPIEDIVHGQRSYKSLVNKFWDYILFIPVLIFFAINLQWFAVAALIVYQVLKGLVAWETEEIYDGYVKTCKNEVIANIKEKTGVQAFVADAEGEKVEV